VVRWLTHVVDVMVMLDTKSTVLWKNCEANRGNRQRVQNFVCFGCVELNCDGSMQRNFPSMPSQPSNQSEFFSCQKRCQVCGDSRDV
jgi:hypothetical protein